MTIETARLLLRPWEETDAEVLYRYAKDPAVGPAAGWPVHTSVENSREIIRTVLSEPETYAVVLRETGEPVGSVGIMPPGKGSGGNPERELEIGYWIGVPYWGRGLIPEAVEALLRRCFLDFGCDGVFCGYFEGNEKSRRVQEKCGFLSHHTAAGALGFPGEERAEHFTYLSRDRWMERAGDTKKPTC